MGHPATENLTPFVFEPVFVADEEGRPLLVAVVKATYALSPDGLTLAQEQEPPLLAGDCYGEPETASYRYEPEGGLAKPATDVVLVGSAAAPRANTTELLVAFQVGPLKKGLKVVGERAFFKTLTDVGMTKPVPFEKIPLHWERAFGGWDKSNPDAKRPQFEPRNPVGVGFRGSGTRFEEGLRCPNLEDPTRPFKGWSDRPTPVGFGFVSPNWEPRTQHAGTYDEAWEKDRAPLLPKNFDRRFLNAAPAGQVAPGHLKGDEPVVVTGVRPEGGYSFKLPGVAAPEVTVARSGLPDAPVKTRLDTVIVDTDAQKVILLWKGELVLRREPTEISAMRVQSGTAGNVLGTKGA